MLSSIEALHDIGVLHRDIKPGNFCMGANSQSGERVRCYLIDFGLSRRYLTTSGRVREARLKVGFRGTARYASINAHLGLELGRCDDLWSFFYVLIEFLIGQLPWKGREKEKIGEMKQTMTNTKLIAGLPEPVFQLYYHINSLTYGDRPNYNFMRQCLSKLFFCSGEPKNVPYDWEVRSIIKSARSTSQILQKYDNIIIKEKPDELLKETKSISNKRIVGKPAQIISMFPSQETQTRNFYCQTPSTNVFTTGAASGALTTHLGTSPVSQSNEEIQRRYTSGSIPVESYGSKFAFTSSTGQVLMAMSESFENQSKKSRVQKILSMSLPITPNDEEDFLEEQMEFDNLTFLESPPTSPESPQNQNETKKSSMYQRQTFQKYTPHPPASLPKSGIVTGSRFRKIFSQQNNSGKPRTQPISTSNYTLSLIDQQNIPNQRNYQANQDPQQNLTFSFESGRRESIFNLEQNQQHQQAQQSQKFQFTRTFSQIRFKK
ncbi:Tau-tubulin kinase 2 [Nowakowskiella sp. JEL0078]|nr:Tau-tubulin kinase 2 [Nowakowskiella sp. JEL0078]